MIVKLNKYTVKDDTPWQLTIKSHMPENLAPVLNSALSIHLKYYYILNR